MQIIQLIEPTTARQIILKINEIIENFNNADTTIYVSFTPSSDRSNISPNENLSTLFGKIVTWFNVCVAGALDVSLGKDEKITKSDLASAIVGFSSFEQLKYGSFSINLDTMELQVRPNDLSYVEYELSNGMLSINYIDSYQQSYPPFYLM